MGLITELFVWIVVAPVMFVIIAIIVGFIVSSIKMSNMIDID